MLVLSRRETEKILFPSLGISVEVLRIRGNLTKLGIDAPPEIPVVRHEVADRKSIELTPDDSNTRAQLCDLARVVRCRLDSAATALNRLHAILDDQSNGIVQEIVMQLYHDLQALEREADDVLESSSKPNSRSVLVVADDSMERKLLASVLEMSGLEVTTASNGQDALDFLTLHATPDAVLVDMSLPCGDGPRFVQQVRSNPQFMEMRIFAIRGIEPNAVGRVTDDSGIDGWIEQPLEPHELIRLLSERLNTPLAA